MNDPQKEAREIAARNGVKAYEPPAETAKQEPCECRKRLEPLRHKLSAFSMRHDGFLFGSILCEIDTALAAPCSCEQLREERIEQYQRAQSLQDSLLAEICRANKAVAECSRLQESFRAAAAQSERSRQYSIAAQKQTELIGVELEKQVDCAYAAEAERDRLQTECEQLRAGNTKAAALDKFADYCRERNELVAELSASRSLLEEARLALEAIANWGDFRSTSVGFTLADIARAGLAKIEASRTPEVKP